MVVFWPEKNVKVTVVCPAIVGERILSLIQFNGCTCEKIMTNDPVLAPKSCVFSGITGTPAEMSSLMKALETLEWDAPDKIYIFVSSKKKNGGKKNGKTAGTEAPAGREGGDPEGADRAAEYGEAPGVDGDCNSCGNPDLPGPEGIS